MRVPSEVNILVIEDDEDLREAIIESLSLRGLHVIGVECAEELPEQAKILQIDILILDLNLPGEDGLSLAKRLKNSHPMMGIIMMSARVLSDQRSVGYASGADIYLPKPCNSEELYQSILSLSRRLNDSKQLQPTKNTKLHLKKLIISRQGVDVALTHNEALLLASFSRAPQNTLEIWQIAEILNINLDVMQKSVIELNISRLRKKLIDCGESRNSIRAIRGVGYMLSIEIVLTR